MGCVVLTWSWCVSHRWSSWTSPHLSVETWVLSSPLCRGSLMVAPRWQLRARCPDFQGQTKPHLLHFYGSQLSPLPCFHSRSEYTFSSSVESATDVAGERVWLPGREELGIPCMVALDYTQVAKLTAQGTRYTLPCIALCLVLSIHFLRPAIGSLQEERHLEPREQLSKVHLFPRAMRHLYLVFGPCFHWWI